MALKSTLLYATASAQQFMNTKWNRDALGVVYTESFYAFITWRAVPSDHEKTISNMSSTTNINGYKQNK